MNLGDLINAVGQDVMFQLLDDTVTDVRKVKRGSLVTIVTDAVTPGDFAVPGTSQKMGFVVWLPRDKVNELIKVDETST